MEDIREELQTKAPHARLPSTQFYKEVSSKLSVGGQVVTRINECSVFVVKSVSVITPLLRLPPLIGLQAPLPRRDFDAALRELANEPAPLITLDRDMVIVA